MWVEKKYGYNKKSKLQLLITMRGLGNKEDGSQGKNWILNAFMTLSGWIFQTAEVFPWYPSSLQHRSTLFSSVLRIVFGARICITQSYRLKVPDREPRSCLDWLIVSNNVPQFGSVLLAGSCCQIRLATGAQSVTYKPRICIVLGNPPCFCYVSMGPSAKPLPCLTEFDMWGWRFVIGARVSVLVG